MLKESTFFSYLWEYWIFGRNFRKLLLGLRNYPYNPKKSVRNWLGLVGWVCRYYRINRIKLLYNHLVLCKEYWETLQLFFPWQSLEITHTHLGTGPCPVGIEILIQLFWFIELVRNRKYVLDYTTIFFVGNIVKSLVSLSWICYSEHHFI